MWQIFKAELRYNALSLMFTTAFICFFAILFARAKLLENPGIIFFVPLTVTVIMHFMIYRSIEKRDRKDVLLPLSLKRIAVARLLLIVLPTAFFCGIYWLIYVFAAISGNVWQHDSLDLLMFIGVIFMCFALYLIQHDSFISAMGRGKAAEFDLLALVLMLLVFLMGIPLTFAAIWQSPTSEMLRVMAFFLGVIFLFLSITAFTKRKTYLE